MKNSWLRSVVSSSLALLSAVLSAAPASAAYQWEANNTCWADFDVGGEWFCGIRTPACANPGIYCKDFSGNDIGQPWPSSENQPPSYKAIAMDEDGFPLVIGTDNKIYYTPYRNGDWSWQLLRSGPKNSDGTAVCIDKLAVHGSTQVDGVYLLARSCGPNSKAWHNADGTWRKVAEAYNPITDISAGYMPNETSPKFFILSNITGNPLLYSSGGRNFVQLKSQTYHNEAGVTPTAVYLPTRTGGPFLAGDFGVCSPTSGITSIWFEQVWSPTKTTIVNPDPGGCTFLQPPSGGFRYQGAPRMVKLVDGPKGPGAQDKLWILTNIGRVYALSGTP